MVRASACHAEGRRFEPGRLRHLTLKIPSQRKGVRNLKIDENEKCKKNGVSGIKCCCNDLQQHLKARVFQQPPFDPEGEDGKLMEPWQFRGPIKDE